MARSRILKLGLHTLLSSCPQLAPLCLSPAQDVMCLVAGWPTLGAAMPQARPPCPSASGIGVRTQEQAAPARKVPVGWHLKMCRWDPHQHPPPRRETLLGGGKEVTLKEHTGRKHRAEH